MDTCKGLLKIVCQRDWIVSTWERRKGEVDREMEGMGSIFS
jgi:hypothetical protein